MIAYIYAKNSSKFTLELLIGPRPFAGRGYPLRARPAGRGGGVLQHPNFLMRVLEYATAPYF